MDVDEHPRPEVTTAQMAKLPPVFMKGGTVNAANASVSFRGGNRIYFVLKRGGEGRERPRPEVTTAQMAKLLPVFMKG